MQSHWPHSKFTAAFLLLLSLSFIAAGLNHFYAPHTYLRIMPDYLPYHLELIYISGIFEVLGGLGVLFNASRYWAGLGLIALTLAVSPVHIHMALHPERYADVAAAWVWYARLPLQGIILYWIYVTCLKKPI